jgi:putative heme-binding domain-containing protein
MRSIRTPCAFVFTLGIVLSSHCAADDPKPDSPLVRMLKTGRVPEERQATIVEMIGKRGNADDLGFLFQKAARSDGFPAAIRPKALTALADAALTRQLKPKGDYTALASLIKSEDDTSIRLSAIRLAGLWKAESLVPDLKAVAESSDSIDSLRSAAFDALATIGGKSAHDAITSSTSTKTPKPVRAAAVAALAKIDADAATRLAVGVLNTAPGGGFDLGPFLAAFLNMQGGADKLAAALAANKLPADSAKLALRSMYAMGYSDPSVVVELSKAAGLDAEVKPLDKAALDQLITDVAARGNPERGEQIFRRGDLNCSKCHALSGAGGGIGPELSPIGSSSPVDYIVNSIMLPDQAIKEQYLTKIVLTNDGRVYHGIVVDKDENRLILREGTGDERTIPASEIEADKDGGSLMPKGLVNFMTRAEFVDLVRFLSELGKPGPYGIRATASIQRWRYLKAVPESLSRAVPDAATFKSQVLNAEPDRWLPAYGKVGGGLPLDELLADSGSKVVYVQGEINATQPGLIALRFNSVKGMSAWVDEQVLALDGPTSAMLSTGRHRLTLRIDTASRPERDIMLEVVKPDGSRVEFSVVGGR